MNLSIITVIVGWVIALEGVLFLPSVITGLIYGETMHAVVYLVLAVVCIILGLLLRGRKNVSQIFYAREGLVAVALCWIVLGLIGALPFFLTGDIPSYCDAVFEIISGFTTTGSSILTDVEALSHANLFWRSFSHWIGGMGVLVFVLAILPKTGSSYMNLMKAESPGPTVGKLVPKVQQTAFMLYAIYMAMTLVEIVLLLLGGMPLFEALCHAFGTAGTGGFGVKGDSIAGYSIYLQNVITLFMFLFGVNFTFYYYVLIRKPKDALGMEEVRWYVLIYLGAVALITTCLALNGNGILTSLQQVAFQVASVMTTTGYATADFDKWPEFARCMMVCIMFIGACAGSTGGGIKVSRIMMYVRQGMNEIAQQVHPRRVRTVKLDGKIVDRDTLRTTNIFLMVYAFIFMVSLLIVTLDGFDLTVSFPAVAATLNNIGPGLGMVGPTGNFSEFSILAKIVLIVDMLMGRLEIWPMIILFHPGTWKK